MSYTLKVPANKNDHYLGDLRSPVMLVEYGDYECPYCARLAPVIDRLMKEYAGEICYVYRHFPLTDIHTHAALAALGAEAAGKQGLFWEMHRKLYKNSGNLSTEKIIGFADELQLDRERFLRDLDNEEFIEHIRQDLSSGDHSGAEGTPAFFINGIRYDAENNYESLRAEIDSVLRENSSTF